MMDLYKGWPFEGAINDNAVPKTGAGIDAGMAIKKDVNGELIKADGTAGEKAYFALDSQLTDLVVTGARSLAYIVGNAIVLTDQYDTTKVYGYGTEIMVDAGNPGKFTPWLAGSPVFGHSDGFVTRDEVTYLKIVMPLFR